MMRWSRMPRHLMSVVRMQSSNITTTKLVRLDESKVNNNIVAAAFESLKEIDNDKSRKSSFYIINNTIDNATTVEEILAISEIGLVSKQHALKAVSTLAEWASSGRVKLAEFETDIRFLKLCRMLGKENSKEKENLFSDLSTVLGITGDDEAAKLISSISLPQMVKVLSTIGAKKKRSTTLLRSLAFNIGRCSEKMDIKQCADVLYALAILNFPDEVLLEKVSADVRSNMSTTDRPSVIGSIVTSIGILRYRDPDLLDSLSTWLEKHIKECKQHILISYLLTLAYVNYKPNNMDNIIQTFKSTKQFNDVGNLNTWLDIIWSLVVLEKADNELLASVLSPDFISNLMKLKGNKVVSIKLLNINGYAKTKLDYKGPLLDPDSEIFKLELVRSKDKQVLMKTLIDSLSIMFPSENFVKTNFKTDLGFIIDAECALDSKLNPIPLDSPKLKSSETHQIAFMLSGFHDMCRGCHNEPNGISALNTRLVHSLGYKVLAVPYTELSTRDSLVNNVQYLKESLKNLLSEP
ncbi:FAST kinase domain-containing protein 4 isoform X1 [Melanaphis sacchari]|uniref:FAST kinase domain-containing protein 4 isoform X1 n=1 Tax=Melanaphis sacchari TaxID=742174 RepID=UPI000DC1438A|nr:FAST kinase domain-containing protein 4 isoform X1 [Melanaphis sacchari]XP_025194836.1 FAST kinase domain-containing protein 4 isoform X1 [Melanaphis sacchari]XP_025194837.1 FAST kinase domain-containing protein 4 isoform X1 [Melanaphis sacchari]